MPGTRPDRLLRNCGECGRLLWGPFYARPRRAYDAGYVVCPPCGWLDATLDEWLRRNPEPLDATPDEWSDWSLRSIKFELALNQSDEYQRQAAIYDELVKKALADEYARLARNNTGC